MQPLNPDITGRIINANVVIPNRVFIVPVIGIPPDSDTIADYVQDGVMVIDSSTQDLCVRVGGSWYAIKLQKL